jgi:7,8-dihydropterin-6-yl-methyl-4-(beta-D-ribofuranosyl)aminobenzene 5'-phosphate synthase
MTYRISPAWWPIIALSSPLLLPLLLIKNRRFKKNKQRSREVNDERIRRAKPLPLPLLDHLDLTVLVEQKTEPGFLGAPGVSYLIKTDRGALLFDVGFGPEMPALAHNARKIGFQLAQADALAISHLHPDHMGGLQAVRTNRVTLPREIGEPQGKPCFVPAGAAAEGLQTEVVEGPCMLAAGIASTGPLARSLFFFGWTEEQALVARLKGKGLVIITGCGHPTIERIIEMVRKISGEPIYAVGGGLHLPITDSPMKRRGIKIQMIVGTGKPPWRRVTDADVSRTIHSLNAAGPQRVFLSAHDTCDYAIGRFKDDLKSETKVLRAGATYQL